MSRNVVLLGVVSFFADVSSEMIYPIVPLFLSGPLGAPAVAVGLIEGIAESTASILKWLSGWWSDRLQRRVPMAFAGYGLAAIAKPLLAAAYAWPFVLFVRFVDRTGKGIRGAPRDALIAESTTREAYGRAFGLHRTMDTGGAISGPLIAIGLLAWLGDERYRPVFLLAVVPGVLSVLALMFVREARRASTAPSERPQLLSLHGYDRGFLIFLGVTLVFALGNSSDAFLILRSQDLGLGATEVILAYVLYNIAYAGLSLPAGDRADRIGPRRVLIAGFVVFALVYGGFALASDAWAVWPLFIVYGAYIAMTDGVGKAYVSQLVPAERRATALGAYNAATGVMLLIASVLGGGLWDLFGPPATFALGASSALAAAALLLALPGSAKRASGGP